MKTISVFPHYLFATILMVCINFSNCAGQNNYDHFVNTLYQLENHHIDDRKGFDYLSEFLTEVNNNYSAGLSIDKSRNRITVSKSSDSTAVVIENREWDQQFETQLWQLCIFLEPIIRSGLNEFYLEVVYNEFIGDLLISCADKYGWALLKETQQNIYKLGTNGISTIRSSSGHYVVESVRIGSTSWKKGLKKGDEIISVKGTNTSLIGHGYFLKLSNDTAGAFVPTTVLRGSQKIPLELAIEPKSSLSNFELDTSVNGYPDVVKMRIRYFNDKVQKQLADIVSNGKFDNAKLIIDLRGSEGGQFFSIRNSLDLFYNYGDSLWLSRSRKPYGGREKKHVSISLNNKRNVFESIYLLTDENTVSGAEMFLIPFKHNSNGVIVGSQTVGQLMTWKYFPYNGNSTSYTIKVTTNESLTPNGDRVAGIGIQPDISLSEGVDALAYVLKNLIAP